MGFFPFPVAWDDGLEGWQLQAAVAAPGSWEVLEDGLDGAWSNLGEVFRNLSPPLSSRVNREWAQELPGWQG